MLRVLALNPPGSTETHALLPGSAATDLATDCTDVTGVPVLTDQRGYRGRRDRPDDNPAADGPLVAHGLIGVGGARRPVEERSLETSSGTHECAAWLFLLARAGPAALRPQPVHGEG